MDYPFPPLPPEYLRVVVARWLLLVVILAGFVRLAHRVRDPKRVRMSDMAWWVGLALIGGLLTLLGHGPYLRNDWLLPLGVAVQSVAIAGLCETILTKWPVGGQRFLGAMGVTFVLVGMLYALIPEVGRARTAAKRSQCRNNLKQIGLAMHNYHDDFSVFASAIRGNPPVSWRVSILPYVDQAALFADYDQRAAWDVAPNDKVAHVMLNLYRCPSNSRPKDAQDRWFTAYSMPTGRRTVGASPTGMTIKGITDGTSNTLLVVEACGAQIVWTEPRDVDVGVQPTGINLKGNTPGHSAGWLSSYHAGGTQVLLADGSVRFLSTQTDPALLKKLATVDGGEEIGDY